MEGRQHDVHFATPPAEGSPAPTPCLRGKGGPDDAIGRIRVVGDAQQLVAAWVATIGGRDQLSIRLGRLSMIPPPHTLQASAHQAGVQIGRAHV